MNPLTIINKRSVFSIAAIVILLAQATILSAEDSKAIAEVRAKLPTALPGIPVDHLSESAVPGIYEIITEGQVFYVDKTVSYIFDGSLVDLTVRENLTEASLLKQNLRYIDAVGEDNMVVYQSATTEPTRTMSVFTDLDCPYCQRLHSELDTLLDAGIKVRYLMYPRTGLNTKAHKKLESVWCADDRLAAMTAAKNGKYAKKRECDNPITQHVLLAQQLKLKGTPMIFLDSGQRIDGYLDAATLIEVFDETVPLAY